MKQKASLWKAATVVVVAIEVERESTVPYFNVLCT
jgi:hypothetical protein